LAAPYDVLQSVLNVARERVLDAIKTPSDAPAGQVGGEVLSTSVAREAYTLQVVNGAWRRFQEALAAQNFSRLLNTVVLSSAPAVTTADPSTSCYINWDGYFDGSVLQAVPKLPQDLITPLRLKERVHVSSGTVNQFTEMEYVVNELTGSPKRDRNHDWTWERDALSLPGSTSIMDLELRYSAYLSDFVDNSPALATPWYNQAVPIMRCMDAFAWYIAAEAANARGDVDGAALDVKAEAATTKLVQREMQNQVLRGEQTVPDIPAASGNSPYDAVSTIWNAVRTRLNSTAKIPADLLYVAQPFAQQCANNGYRRFQDFLANMGYIRLTDEVVILDIPGVPSAVTDPASQVYVDWNGYHDGVTLNAAKVLPRDLIFPTVVMERIAGQDALFQPMEQMLDGLPALPRQSGFNGMWEWRVDAIYMPGASQATDLKIRYAKYLPDFVANGATPWYLAQVPIARCSDALSLFFCAEVAMARPDLEIDPLDFTNQAQAAAKFIFNRDARMKQRVNVRRLSHSGRLEGNNNRAAWG
jgi:hypothetical protein